jgi:YbbR domain-containing protein
MFLKPLRWFGKNLSNFLLAFLLALVVWVSAVLSADPNERRTLSRPVEIQVIGKDPDLKIMGSFPNQVTLTLVAPRSIWDRLEKDQDAIHAWIDCSALKEGEHTLPVQVQINISLVRKISQDPEEVSLVLESLVSQPMQVNLITNGEPPLGYQAEASLVSPQQVSVSGPVSLVSRVVEVRAFMDISGATETITRTLTISPLDSEGKVVNGIVVSPNTVAVTQPVSLLGGYRNVIVKVVTTGNVANGYRLTNYFVNPSSVIVFSADPVRVNALPGYVETRPLDLTNQEDDFEAFLELNLPPGVVAVSDTRVSVQVSIAAIESSLTISLPLEVVGLSPGLEAQVAPITVDLILSGPVPVLNALKPGDIRVKMDLTSYTAGVYQILPVVDFLPARVQKVSIIPSTIEVTILNLPTATPTPTPAGRSTLTPTPTKTLTPTPRP